MLYFIMEVLSMKLRKIATMATAVVMTMSIFTGCGSESYKVEYKPVKGDEYGVVSTISIELSTSFISHP